MMHRFGLCLALFIFGNPALADPAAQAKAGADIKAADGQLRMTVPGDWEVKQPKVRIIEHELSLPAAEGDANPGRLTMMMAGGSLQANLDRWKGQMKLSAEPAQEEFEVAQQKVHLLDLKGTYLDRRGPFGPAVPRDDYRMLGAVVELKAGGLFFLKLYGPKATIDANEQKFRQLLQGIQAP